MAHRVICRQRGVSLVFGAKLTWGRIYKDTLNA
jgi:hypothetical protein